jgi:hypothetical protein
MEGARSSENTGLIDLPPRVIRHLLLSSWFSTGTRGRGGAKGREIPNVQVGSSHNSSDHVTNAPTLTGHGPSPPQLNNQIRDADGREALLGLVVSKGDLFDAMNVATCLNR